MEEKPKKAMRRTLLRSRLDEFSMVPPFLARHGKIYATAIRLASCIPAIRLEYPNLDS